MEKKKYPTQTSILGKLIAMIVARHGNARGIKDPKKLFTRLRGLAITPDLPDAQIEEVLQKMVDAGEFGGGED